MNDYDILSVILFKVAIRTRVWHPVLAFRKLVNIYK
jgi:hypothetical protein